jgi:hypothetical protein
MALDHHAGILPQIPGRRIGGFNQPPRTGNLVCQEKETSLSMLPSQAPGALHQTYASSILSEVSPEVSNMWNPPLPQPT